MNVGLVARADDRGIGTMTWEFYKAMRPARTLVVREPGAERRGFAPNLDRYVGDVVRFDPILGKLPEQQVRDFLDGLDVVYLVETPYDFRFFEWARDAGCSTVLHAMPEFWRWSTGEPRPDVWWLPTSWRAELLPIDCRVVEVPVPIAPHRPPSHATASPVKFVHVAGHRAVGDRNGTLLLFQAMRNMRERCTVRMFTQDARLPTVRTHPNIDLQCNVGGLADRWSLFDDADVLVLPRRYGGLCLPVLEAMACGVGLVMSDVEPQSSTWPILAVPARRGRSVEMPCGTIKLLDADPIRLGRMLDGLAADPAIVDDLRRQACEFAAERSWAMLRPMYVDELARACA